MIDAQISMRAERTSGVLSVSEIGYTVAARFIGEFHRHSPNSPPGHFVSLACFDGDRLVGVAMVGRPEARGHDDGRAANVTRLATDGTRNACSKLYAAANRWRKRHGFVAMRTYTLESESGASLRAAGWIPEATVKARRWTCPSRPRRARSVEGENKIRWRAP